MQRIATLAAVATLGALLLGGAPTTAAPLRADAHAASVTDVSAQSRPRRPRAAIIVRPRGYPYRTFHSFYPLPYDIEYPGPGFVRQCAAWLAPEARPSGTVIVPRSRCWWARG